MSIRRIMNASSLCLLYAATLLSVSCRRETAQGPAAKKEPAKTTTAVVQQDLRNAKVKTVVGTAVVEQTTSARLGSHASPEGLVIEEKSTFKAGEPIILSMTVQQSPAGLQMSAVWEDAKGKTLDQDRKSMKGGKIATFAYAGKKKLPPGQYKVIGYWGGNIAAERKFTVTK
jgi:hypothetical protein